MTRLPASSDRTAPTPTFKDGLGARVRVTDAGGDPVEHLQLVPEIAAQESAVRDRVGRLINFRHARYVRLRGVERAKTGLKPLVIAYDALEGHRLSTVLESVGSMALSVDVDVALQIVRDLLPAIGILHDSRKVTHGAIAPERLVYTSQQRLVIVDHGLGAALMRLNLPRKKLWEQFRIASPASNRAVFDDRMDVVQIGLVALALLLGRPLADEEYPAQIKRLIFSVKETSSRIGSRPIGPELRRWLERATGVDDAQMFGSIKEAQDAFETVVAVDRYAPTAATVKGFFQRYEELVARAAPVVAAPAESATSSVDLDSALSELQMQVKITPRRRAAADPPPAAADAVDEKPASRAKGRAAAKVEEPKGEAPAEPAAKPEGVSLGRRKSDRLDALQALQEEMSAAAEDSAGRPPARGAAVDATQGIRQDDKERLAREVAERARQEAETRERAEREGRALAEQVARDAAEQVAREAADRAAAERQARAASEREAVERGARQEAERQAHEASLRATREAAEREAAERAARDAQAREGSEREARQRLERESVEAAERRAREQAEREAAEKAAQARRDEEARERDARTAADTREAVERARQEAGAEAAEKARQEAVAREAAEQARHEAAAREAAERQAREQAERESREHAERATREAAERAAAERAALEAAARAEKEAAVRAAAERAAQEAAARAERAERDAEERAERALRESAAREAAERQARELAEREARAAERALKEAADRAAAEQAAREAAERAAREASERAAAERAALEASQRAEREAADREAAERAAHEATERAAREATERAAAERAARQAAEREAAHKAAREMAEQAVLEAAEREAAHRLALQAAELAVREAAERADVERAARQAAEQAAREASQRALADLAAQHADARGDYETAGRVAAERAAREHAEAAEQERVARQQAQLEAREAGERARREAAERAAAERAAREHAARAEAEREARAAAEREARAAADRAERHAAERHAAERAAREAATLMEAERQARAAAEQAAREAAGREAAERAAREAAELAVGTEPRRRRRKKRLAGRTPEEASAVQPLPSESETVAPVPATFSAGAAPAAPATFQWQPGQSVEVLPAWARGAATGAASSAGDVEPATYTPPPSATLSDVYAPADPEPSASILPFKPQADTWMQRAPQLGEAAEADARAVPPGPTSAPRRSFRINWARTLAASLLVALLEGVAFATAWWYVTPEQQGWLVVHTKPAGIQISVDGQVLGKTPFAQPLAPGRHTIELRYGTGTRVVPVEISAGVQTEQRLTWGNGFTTGQASISSSTAGAKVMIDGRVMGKTPLTVSDLLPGKHEVTVEGETGSVSTMLIVEAGQTTELDVPVYAGWASVLSPVQLDILLDGKLVGSTEIEKLMLRPGRHTLELVNESLGYRGSVEVRVRPGATTSVSVVPKTPVTIEAPEGTELSINGENMGTLPNAGLQVPLGTAEFVMRHKDEERRQVVPVTMSAPVTVKYELASVVDRQ